MQLRNRRMLAERSAHRSEAEEIANDRIHRRRTTIRPKARLSNVSRLQIGKNLPTTLGLFPPVTAAAPSGCFQHSENQDLC